MQKGSTESIGVFRARATLSPTLSSRNVHGASEQENVKSVSLAFQIPSSIFFFFFFYIPVFLFFPVGHEQVYGGSETQRGSDLESERPLEKSTQARKSQEKDEGPLACQWTDRMELWGTLVKSGEHNLQPTPEECCQVIRMVAFIFVSHKDGHSMTINTLPPQPVLQAKQVGALCIPVWECMQHMGLAPRDSHVLA